MTNIITATIIPMIIIAKSSYIIHLYLFFNNYFNDLIAVPLYFALINIISIHLRDKEINSFKILFILTIILSLLGEYASIFVRKGSVTDYLDIVCYFIGMIIYYLLKNYKKLNWRFINGFI